jgi:hypothetical protein
MGNERDSVDVVVRHVDGYSLTLAPARTTESDLLLVGTLIDPEWPEPVDTRVSVAVDPELRGGRHIERVTALTAFLQDGEKISLAWKVETLDLGDGFRLHDARVSGDVGKMRAFAIEDLFWIAGAGLAAGVIGLANWIRSGQTVKRAEADRDREILECRKSGGSPNVRFKTSNEIGVSAGGLRSKTAVEYHVTCIRPKG